MKKRKQWKWTFWEKLIQRVVFLTAFVGTTWLTGTLVSLVQLGFWVTMFPWILLSLFIVLKWGEFLLSVFIGKKDVTGKGEAIAGMVVSNSIMCIYLGLVYLFQQIF